MVSLFSTRHHGTIPLLAASLLIRHQHLGGLAEAAVVGTETGEVVVVEEGATGVEAAEAADS